jgi:chemotaxis protein histidine kinase CheA
VSGAPAFDPSLLDLFRAELEIHLPALNEGLLALEKDPDQPKRLEALMRAAHSIKGAAKIVGLDAAVRVAHALEDCFVAAQKGQVTLTSDAVDVLLSGADAVPHVVPPAEDLPEEEISRLLDAIATVRAGQAHPPRAAAGPLILQPAGNLDAAAAEQLRVTLADYARQGVPQVRLDFAAVSDVDPVGLALLALLARHQPAPAVQLVNVPPPLRMLLRLTRLDRTFSATPGGR